MGRSPNCTRRCLLLGCLALVGCHNVLVQYSSPMVASGVQQLVHGQSFTINGSGFGTKSGALAPLLRDTGADAAVGSISPQWTGGDPNSAQVGSTFAIQNHAVGFNPTGYGGGIGAPNPYVSKITAGAYAGASSGGFGLWKAIASAGSNLPFVWFASWYERLDPNFVFNINNPTDNNQKLGSYSDGQNPNFSGTNFWYWNFNDTAGFGSITNITQANPCVVTVDYVGSPNPYGSNIGGYVCVTGASGMTQINGLTPIMTAVGGVSGAYTVTLSLDTTGFSAWTSGGFLKYGGILNNLQDNAQVNFYTGTLTFPDAAGHGHFWNAQDNMSKNANGVGTTGSGWVRHKIEILCSSVNQLPANGGGYINVWDGGGNTVIAQSMGFQGASDTLGVGVSADRNVALGSYCRNYNNNNNYRYISDVYMDVTAQPSTALNVARVEVGNNSVYANCTILEPSIATAWANGSITFTFWKGALVGGSTGYIYVQTESGSQIAAGSATIAASP